jgi:hypothetical protein
LSKTLVVVLEADIAFRVIGCYRSVLPAHGKSRRRPSERRQLSPSTWSKFVSAQRLSAGANLAASWMVGGN